MTQILPCIDTNILELAESQNAMKYIAMNNRHHEIYKLMCIKKTAVRHGQCAQFNLFINTRDVRNRETNIDT